jgi:trk system potassium uptake protein TrkA
VSEQNGITVIDTDARALRELESRFDLRGVVGNGIDPQVLAEAGAKDTDLLIACASMDETNLVCCKIAQAVFDIPTRIARVRSSSFAVDDPVLGKEGFAVDRIICPEESVTQLHPQAHRIPGSHAGARLCGRPGRPGLGARARAPAVGLQIAQVRERMPELAMRIVAIYRRFMDEPDRFVRCDGATRIEPGDEVFMLAATEHVSEALKAINPRRPPEPPVFRIMIAGGGQVSLRLARKLAQTPGRFRQDRRVQCPAMPEPVVGAASRSAGAGRRCHR